LAEKVAGRRDDSGVTSKELGLRRATTFKIHNPNMSSPTLKAAILVVSTTASKDPSADSSGGILSDVFEKDGGGKWEVVETKIVGDDVLDIQRSVTGWADREDTVNLIITTGGTGFALHDSTPEVSDV
jgi:gephyrin